MLVVDPSYLVQKGLDQVQAMANRLFSMLATVEEVVVLLDEFDEMGRTRTGNENLLSRFITTAMLPKLIAINEAKKIVFLLATNYASGFDAAFSREGRFDMRLQVMPPNVEAKLDCPEWNEILTRVLDLLSDKDRKTARNQIHDLTFAETESVVGELKELTKAEGIKRALKSAWGACTLQKPNDDRTIGGQPAENYSIDQEKIGAQDGEKRPRRKNKRLTWKETSKNEQSLIRLPLPLPLAASTGSANA